jgi:prevent-host-death family protein
MWLAMETINISRAKARLLQLIAKACRGEEIVITRGSKPVVRLVAVSPRNRPPQTRGPEGQTLLCARCVRSANRRGNGRSRVRVNTVAVTLAPFALRISPIAANPKPFYGLR